MPACTLHASASCPQNGLNRVEHTCRHVAGRQHAHNMLSAMAACLMHGSVLCLYNASGCALLGTGNGKMNIPPEHTNIEELVGLSPRSDVSDDYVAGASPQMSEDEDAAETDEQAPDNMPESSHPSFIVSLPRAAAPSPCM